MTMFSRILAAALLAPAALSAQNADSTKPAKPAISLPPIDVSGTIYANYQYNGQSGASHSQNKFELERVYLTFKSQLSDRTSIRVTTDVYQQTSSPNDAYYKGWTVRAKYAYLQYDYLKNASMTASLRGGLVHSAVLDYEEQFWPRWIAKTAIDQNKFFASSDAGIATIVSLPNKVGEAYISVVNGSGYDNRESDRFKDYQARLALTPFAQNAAVPFLKTLAIMPWYYKGTAASGIAGVTEGRQKDRYGVFVGVRDPRASIGFDYAQRKDQADTGTVASYGTVSTTGRLISAYTMFRPFQIVNATSTIPLGLLARFDQFKPNTSVDGAVNTVIAGLTWDLSKKTALSLDYQESTPQNGSTAAPTKMYYLHWVANF
jgi:hypothetical protein